MNAIISLSGFIVEKQGQIDKVNSSSDLYLSSKQWLMKVTFTTTYIYFKVFEIQIGFSYLV